MKKSHIASLWLTVRFREIPIRMTVFVVANILTGAFFIVWGATGRLHPFLCSAVSGAFVNLLAGSDFSYFKSHLRVETQPESFQGDTRPHDPALSRKIRDGIGRAA